METRPWVSPEGGLYFSVLLEPRIPEEEFPSMSPRLAEAVARIVRSIAGVTENEIWVKPANDVMCEAGKLCGMSLDAKDGRVVLGVGVNVFHPKEPIVTDGRNVARMFATWARRSRVLCRSQMRFQTRFCACNTSMP